MKLELIPVLAFASGLSLAVAACSGSNNAADADATATATPVEAASAAAASHASQFLSDTIQANNAEIKFGQAAQSMGSTQAVRDYGKMLVDDHTRANGQASEIAHAMDVVVPAGIKPDDMAEYNKVTSMKGGGFDKDFAAAMVKAHQKAVDAFRQEVDSGDPAQVTDFARQTLPTLEKHLETAKSLQP